MPTLTIGDNGKISVETSGAGNAGNILLNASIFNIRWRADREQHDGSGQGGSVTLTATWSASFSGWGSGLLSTAASTGNAGEVAVTTPALTMGDGAISVATSGVGNAGNILLDVSDLI